MTNADIRDLLNSTNIEHKNDRAVVTATLPVALLQKLVTAPNSLRSLPQPVREAGAPDRCAGRVAPARHRKRAGEQNGKGNRDSTNGSCAEAW
jgi:hypothetical protein